MGGAHGGWRPTPIRGKNNDVRVAVRDRGNTLRIENLV
jgi:hypothetical protein